MTDVLADAGPAFEPDAGAEPVELPGLDDAAAGGATWSATRVRGLLTAKGELLHNVIAVDPESTEWRYTEADLSTIAAPLARILNRYDATRAAAAAGDEVTVAIGFGGYAVRSYSERLAAIRLQPAAGETPAPYSAAAAAAGAPVEPEPVDVEPDEDRPPTPPIAPRRL